MKTKIYYDMQNNKYVEVEFYDTNIKIIDSYKIRNNTEKKLILLLISSHEEFKKGTHKRSLSSYLREWKGHNVLYRLGIKRSHTKDVDLDEGETLLRKICYAILSIFE